MHSLLMLPLDIKVHLLISPTVVHSYQLNGIPAENDNLDGMITLLDAGILTRIWQSEQENEDQ